MISARFLRAFSASLTRAFDAFAGTKIPLMALLLSPLEETARARCSQVQEGVITKKGVNVFRQTHERPRNGDSCDGKRAPPGGERLTDDQTQARDGSSARRCRVPGDDRAPTLSTETSSIVVLDVYLTYDDINEQEGLI
jgi:hypothetical protein